METINDLKASLQQANDMLSALSNQRNGAQNECVQIAAQLAAANRKIAELEAKVKELTPPVEAPQANGHDADNHAAA